MIIKKDETRHVRWWFVAILLVLPLVTVWNLVVGAMEPALFVMLGPSLTGVTRQAAPDWSLSGFLEGRLQAAVTARFLEALPIRPFLVRLNNQLAFSLFGEVSVPGIMIGAKGQLVQMDYVNEYCARQSSFAETRANRMIPVLLDIQSFYRSRGAGFLYVITPSKAAHLPEYFIDRVDCPSTALARAKMIPDYAERLRSAGVSILDAATLIHGMKGRYPVELFPQGGIHWNSLAIALASLSMLGAINAQAGSEVLPPFAFDYTMGGPTWVDRDLAELINLMFAPVAYLTPKLSYKPSSPCDSNPARFIDAAVVGGSFMIGPAEVLAEIGCMSSLTMYSYLRLEQRGGVPFRVLESRHDLRHLRDVKLLLLEENEASIGDSPHVDALHTLLTD